MISWVLNCWNTIANWIDKLGTYNILKYTTILITIFVLIQYLLSRRNQKNKRPLWMVFLLAIIIDYILISSYYDSFAKTINPKDVWGLISSSLLFLLELCLKSLLCYLLYIFLKTGIQSESITEFAAKFFGFEIQFKKIARKSTVL
jgi:hypothetical protein